MGFEIISLFGGYFLITVTLRRSLFSTKGSCCFSSLLLSRHPKCESRVLDLLYSRAGAGYRPVLGLRFRWASYLELAGRGLDGRPLSRLLPMGLLSCLLSCRLWLWLRLRRGSGDLPRLWRERDRDRGLWYRLCRRGLYLFSDLALRFGDAIRSRRSFSSFLAGREAPSRDLDRDRRLRLCRRGLCFFSDVALCSRDKSR